MPLEERTDTGGGGWKRGRDIESVPAAVSELDLVPLRQELKDYDTTATRVVDYNHGSVDSCAWNTGEAKQTSPHAHVIPVILDNSAQMMPVDRHQKDSASNKARNTLVSCKVGGNTHAARRRREERSGSFPGISIIGLREVNAPADAGGKGMQAGS